MQRKNSLFVHPLKYIRAVYTILPTKIVNNFIFYDLHLSIQRFFIFNFIMCYKEYDIYIYYIVLVQSD